MKLIFKGHQFEQEQPTHGQAVLVRQLASVKLRLAVFDRSRNEFIEPYLGQNTVAEIQHVVEWFEHENLTQ